MLVATELRVPFRRKVKQHLVADHIEAITTVFVLVALEIATGIRVVRPELFHKFQRHVRRQGVTSGDIAGGLIADAQGDATDENRLG
jgi:hypothetical protein